MQIFLHRLALCVFLIGSTAFAAGQGTIDEKKIIGAISKIVEEPKSEKKPARTTVYVKTLEGLDIPFVFENYENVPPLPSPSPPASAPAAPAETGVSTQGAAATAGQASSVSSKLPIATIPAGKYYRPGQLVEGIPEGEASKSKYLLDIVGATISGTVIEISPDKSWIIVRTQHDEDDTAPYSPNTNVSLQTGSKFGPIVSALRRGDGVNAAYRKVDATENMVPTYSVQALEWQSAPVGRLARWMSLLGAAAVLLAIAFVFTRAPRTLILGEDNRYSTSKFQAVLWFWLVISGYMAIVFHRMLAAGWDYVGGVDIPTNLLVLSGISVLSYAGAKAVTQSQIDEAAAKGVVARTMADAPSIKNLITSKGDRVDVGDYQMVVITILAVIVYAVGIVEFMGHIEFRRQVTMPDVDATLLTVFGLGQAAYLGKKYAGETPSAYTSETALQATQVIAQKAKLDVDKADEAAQQAIATVREARAAADKADLAITAKAKTEAVREADAALALAASARSAADAAMAAAKAAQAKAKDAGDFLANFGKGGNAAGFDAAVKACQAASTQATKSATDAELKVKEIEIFAKSIKGKAESMA